ncbi:hypothetical protein ACF07D_15750 [Leucobacter sp. NPDC015123]|uniref:hypothetical protein n=1 Tax=Leucobacter sp. NPDC015123 TaxID=3364129 RepID=UPI0036F463D1
MCEEVIRKRLELGTDIACVIAEEPLDGDRSSTLSAEAVLAHFLDRSAAGACHRDRRASAIGADLLPIHEPGEEHLASALRAALRGAHRVVATSAYSPPVEMGSDTSRFAAEPAGLDRCGVAVQADELGTADDDSRVQTAPGAETERSTISSPTFAAVPLPVDGALHRPDPPAGRAGDRSGVPLAA